MIDYTWEHEETITIQYSENKFLTSALHLLACLDYENTFLSFVINLNVVISISLRNYKKYSET